MVKIGRTSKLPLKSLSFIIRSIFIFDLPEDTGEPVGGSYSAGRIF